VLGVVLDVKVLVSKRLLQRIAEELADVGDGLQFHEASS
jgi:hypothetical protein